MNSTGFRSMVSNNRLAAALVAAFVSTHMATVTGYWYRMIGLAPDANFKVFVTLDWPAFNGLLIRPGATLFGPEQYWAGFVSHSLTGICWGLIFAFLIHPMLRIKNSTRGNLLKGLIWGMTLALISALWWVPSLFPAFNPGFLSHNLGWYTTIGIFIWHAVYGLTLGAFYNPLPDQG